MVIGQENGIKIHNIFLAAKAFWTWLFHVLLHFNSAQYKIHSYNRKNTNKIYISYFQATHISRQKYHNLSIVLVPKHLKLKLPNLNVQSRYKNIHIITLCVYAPFILWRIKQPSLQCKWLKCHLIQDCQDLQRYFSLYKIQGCKIKKWVS